MIMLAKRTIKTITSTNKKIDKKHNTLQEKTKLEKKMEQQADQSVYVMLKNDKENFKTNLPCRVIDPAKNKINFQSRTRKNKQSNSQSNEM